MRLFPALAAAAAVLPPAVVNNVPLPDNVGSSREAIVKKGELFYRRWRPFNDHSRHWGFIGGDFKLYDDEIAALEKQIAELRVPREHVIEIKAVAKGGGR